MGYAEMIARLGRVLVNNVEMRNVGQILMHNVIVLPDLNMRTRRDQGNLGRGKKPKRWILGQSIRLT